MKRSVKGEDSEVVIDMIPMTGKMGFFEACNINLVVNCITLLNQIEMLPLF